LGVLMSHGGRVRRGGAGKRTRCAGFQRRPRYSQRSPPARPARATRRSARRRTGTTRKRQSRRAAERRRPPPPGWGRRPRTRGGRGQPAQRRTGCRTGSPREERYTHRRLVKNHLRTIRTRLCTAVRCGRIIRRSRSSSLPDQVAGRLCSSGHAVAIDEQVLKNAERLAEMAGREALVAARQMPLEAFQALTGDGNDITGRRRPGGNRRIAAVGRDGSGRNADVRFHTTGAPFWRCARDARLRAVPGAAASAACYGR